LKKKSEILSLNSVIISTMVHKTRPNWPFRPAIGSRSSMIVVVQIWWCLEVISKR